MILSVLERRKVFEGSALFGLDEEKPPLYFDPMETRAALALPSAFSSFAARYMLVARSIFVLLLS